MPELPEIDTIVTGLRRCLVGETVENVQVRWERSIACPAVFAFEQELRGLTITDVSRRGKFAIIAIGAKYLVVHLRMTGQLLFCDSSPVVSIDDKHVHVMIRFVSGRYLFLRDVRKFGRLYLVDDPETVVADLGPEPLSSTFTAARFTALLVQRHRQIKPMLLDQRVLAGLGNIYVDESLWRAGIHPLRHSDSLTGEEATCLHAAIGRVIRQAIANRGTTLRDYRDPQNEPGGNQWALAVYGREGRPCNRCGQPIERIQVGGRGTRVCLRCQPLAAAEDVPGEA